MWGKIFEGVGVGLAITGVVLAISGAGPLVSMGFATYSVWVGVAGISCTYSRYC